MAPSSPCRADTGTVERRRSGRAGRQAQVAAVSTSGVGAGEDRSVGTRSTSDTGPSLWRRRGNSDRVGDHERDADRLLVGVEHLLAQAAVGQPQLAVVGDARDDRARAQRPGIAVDRRARPARARASRPRPGADGRRSSRSPAGRASSQRAEVRGLPELHQRLHARLVPQVLVDRRRQRTPRSRNSRARRSRRPRTAG